MDDILEQRKKQFFEFFKKNQLYIYMVLFIFVFMGASMRLTNNEILKNEVIELDPYLFLRWSEDIVKNGKLMEIDHMRAYPNGFETYRESYFVSYLIAWMYWPMHWLNPSLTVVNIASWYPVIFFVLGLIMFFIMLKKIFGTTTAILSTGILAFNSGYLFRTFQGYADKEPVSMFLMFLTIYLFYKTWYNEKHNILNSILCGIAFGIAIIAGGIGSFLFIIIGVYVFLDFFYHFEKKKLGYFSIIMVLTFLFMFFTTKRFGGISIEAIESLLTTFSSLIFLGTFGYGMSLMILEKFKDKIETRLPLSVAAILLLGVGGFLVFTLYQGPQMFGEQLTKVRDLLIYPFDTARHTLTVAENRQPYLNEWAGEFGLWFIILFSAGALLFMYDWIKDFSKRWLVFGSYTLLVAGVMFSRVSAGSLMNGTSGASLVFYLGSLILFLGLLFGGFIYAYFKNKELYNEIVAYDKRPLLMIIWFILLLIGARGVVRIFFVFTPIAAVMAGYFFNSMMNKVPKDAFYKSLVLIVFLVYISSSYAYTSTLSKSIGSSLSPQWRAVTDWMRTQTPQDAVFAHWWDYGYWIQTAGQRPTVLDGGQPVASWNYFLGRYVLTGTEEEALNFLYSHNVSYLLIDPSDMGKYGAYSSIGSDANYDKLSYVAVFGLQSDDGVYKHYVGQYGYDGDLKLTNNEILKTGSGGITDVYFTVKNETVESATVTLINNGMPFTKKLSCVYFSGKEYRFEGDNIYPGCFVVVPFIDGQTAYANGAGVFMSNRGRDAFWTKLYLRGHQDDYFKLAYTDDLPLAFYKDKGLWGPVQVWKVAYPEGIEVDPAMLSYEFPEGTFMS